VALIGYGRVSTRDQSPAAQEAELLEAGCERVFIDHGESSRVQDRPEWLACLDYMRAGDTLVVRALDRIAGTEVMAIEILHELGRRGISLRSLTEPALDVDASTPMGHAILSIMAVLVELRVSIIRDNTRRGLDYARSQGRIGGRPTVMTTEKLAIALQLREDGRSLPYIARAVGVSKSTVGRAMARVDAHTGGYDRCLEEDSA
jgi:DNA invertase Pin-like site-specific DNA recombinase